MFPTEVPYPVPSDPRKDFEDNTSTIPGSQMRKPMTKRASVLSRVTQLARDREKQDPRYQDSH